MVRVAPIDIGTVSVRLAVADVEGGRVLRCAKQSRICDLGEGLSETGALSDAACARVLAAVDDYLACARAAGASVACCTLTSAARDASNSDALLSGLAARGLAAEVIPGRVEGALTFLGVARDFPGERILVADNGGGSTELAVGSLAAPGPDGAPGALALEYVRSVDVGCRRVTERCLPGTGPASPEDLARAREFCSDRLRADVPWLPDGSPRTGAAPSDAPGPDGRGDDPTRGVARPDRLVVVGGTVTSLVAIDAALDPYDPTYVHLHELSAEQVDEVARMLAALDVEGRRHVRGLQPQRAPVMLGGAVAVRELMRATGFGSLVASESDLLFGLAVVAASAAPDADGASPIGWAPRLAALS